MIVMSVIATISIIFQLQIIDLISRFCKIYYLKGNKVPVSIPKVYVAVRLSAAT